MNIEAFKSYEHVYFIGIGGISMSGLAVVLQTQGKTISGSDQSQTSLTDHLSDLGMTVNYGHDAAHITSDIDLVVYTAAIPKTNPERLAAEALGIPTMERAVLLGHIMDTYPLSVGVAGTHGKTTTTSMLSHIMLEGGLDPTISVGGMLKGIGGNFKIGNSDYFITEACEYANSYHHFHPNIGIILNIEADHLDFFKDLDAIYDSFKTYVGNIPEDGLLIINDGIERLDSFLTDVTCRVIRVGSHDASIYTYKNVVFDSHGFPSFDLYHKGTFIRRIQMHVTGLHNVENALACIAASKELGLDYDAIQEGLLQFGGADRRFEYKGTFNGVTVIDDYAHHPTEIQKSIEAARQMDIRDLWVIFQPHTYTRTKALMEDFTKVLALADHIIVTDIYAAREKDPGDIHSSMLVETISNLNPNIVYIDDFTKIVNYVREKCVPKDMLITMGAGTVTNLGPMILDTEISTSSTR